jgi:CheY-like chemotaxis protein
MSTPHVRVLVADGDDAVRMALFRALLERNIFCDCVSNAHDALARIGERVYAILLLDLALPDGAANVLELLRGFARPPIIIGSAARNGGAPPEDLDTELVQIVMRRPLRVADVADIVDSCLNQVRTT